jgi:hypothetical protein
VVTTIENRTVRPRKCVCASAGAKSPTPPAPDQRLGSSAKPQNVLIWTAGAIGLRARIGMHIGGSGAAMALAFGTFRDRLTVSGAGPDGPVASKQMTAGKLRRRLFAHRTPGRRTPAQPATQRAALRVTSSAAATVTAVTTATALATRRCAGPAGASRPSRPRTQRSAQPQQPAPPTAANSAPPRSRRPVFRAARNPPTRPAAATADDRDAGVSLIGLTLPAGARRSVPVEAAARFGQRCRPT